MNVLHGLIDPPGWLNKGNDNPKDENCTHCGDRFNSDDLFILVVKLPEKVCSKCLNDFHQNINI